MCISIPPKATRRYDIVPQRCPRSPDTFDNVWVFTVVLWILVWTSETTQNEGTGSYLWLNNQSSMDLLLRTYTNPPILVIKSLISLFALGSSCILLTPHYIFISFGVFIIMHVIESSFITFGVSWSRPASLIFLFFDQHIILNLVLRTSFSRI